MLTQEMLVEAAKLLAANRRPCTREGCKDCDDCRAIELAAELTAAAPAVKDGIWLIQKIDACPGHSFEDDRVCTECNMHARYHRSEAFLKRFVAGVTNLIKGADDQKADQSSA